VNNELKIKWKEVYIVQFTDMHSICMEELYKTSEKPKDISVLAKFSVRLLHYH